MTVTTDPRSEYDTRLEARRATVERHERNHRAVGRLRLTVAIGFALMLWAGVGRGAFSIWWLLLPFAVFVALVVLHARITALKQRAMKAVTFYENGIARIEDRWAGRGQSTEQMRDEAHPYAADLDVFGRASLFELLCTARTRSGEEILAGWLSGPAGQSEILARQAAVEDLRNRIDLREDLAVLGADIRPSIHPATMVQWGAAPSRIPAGWLRSAGLILTVLVVGLFASWVVTRNETLRSAYYVGLLVEAIFFLACRGYALEVLAVAEWPGKYLDLLSQMLARLEREKFNSDKLVELQKSLETGSLPPSQQIAQLGRLIDKLNWKGLDIFVIFAFLYLMGAIVPLSLILLWTPQIAFAVEAWRRRCGPSIERWLSVVGEFEAFCALGNYAFEHPADPFPEIVENGPVVEGEDLCHPLVPAAKCVPNSIHLSARLQMLVVSGSNMSGKSTFMRTVGVNTVLALAGAPVRARRLRVSPLAIGATIRIQDSLQAGTSRFYAEIKRIRDIVELTEGSIAVLFLLDEILHGTNSHDRAIGAEAIVRNLIARGAVGLVTTHDLALARVADALAPRAANVHFDDRLEDGKMAFDYRMQPGVVQKSNALELMRAVGLDV